MKPAGTSLWCEDPFELGETMLINKKLNESSLQMLVLIDGFVLSRHGEMACKNLHFLPANSVKVSRTRSNFEMVVSSLVSLIWVAHILNHGCFSTHTVKGSV